MENPFKNIFGDKPKLSQEKGTTKALEQEQSHEESLSVSQYLTPEQVQQFSQEHDVFLREFEKKALGPQFSNDAKLAYSRFIPDFKTPGEVNITELAPQKIKVDEKGWTIFDHEHKLNRRYITNPETALLDYETLGEPEIFNVNTDKEYQLWLEKNNKKDATVASGIDYMNQTYGDTHYIPGIEYQKYLLENQDKVPEVLKDRGPYYFSGSLIPALDGGWNVPYGYWRDDKWNQYVRAKSISTSHDMAQGFGCNMVMFKK